MKKRTALWAMVPLLGALAAPALAHDRHGTHYHANNYEQRLDRQAARINRGIDDGQLTRKEVRKLRKQQRRTARLEQRFARDGHLSRHERRVLQRRLDRTSERIRRFKHNNHHHGAWGNQSYYGDLPVFNGGWLGGLTVWDL